MNKMMIGAFVGALGLLTPGVVQTLQATQSASKDATSADVKKEDALQAKRENEFRKSLTNAVLEGVWQMTGKGGLHADEPLSESKTERYTIASIVKSGGDYWIVNARIEFGDKDVTVPIPVRVVWAGDTPVITIDDLAIPMIGTYSARVMFHNGFYSGVWYSNAKDYGGILTGRITKAKPKAKTKPAKKPAPAG